MHNWKMTKQTAGLEKRQHRKKTGRKAIVRRRLSARSCPFPALLFGPSFPSPAFSMAWWYQVSLLGLIKRQGALWLKPVINRERPPCHPLGYRLHSDTKPSLLTPQLRTTATDYQQDHTFSYTMTLPIRHSVADYL